MRLKMVSRDDLVVGRVRKGRGHAFFDVEGKPWPVGELRERALHVGGRLTVAPVPARALGFGEAIGRIAPDANAHIQACGLDAAGRVQYIYHPDWEARRARKKQRQLGLLMDALPKIRRQVSQDLSAEAGTRELALAIGVALIDRTAMRVGRERYLDAHGTRGAGTLYSRDVTIKGDAVTLKFPAKSGKVASYTLNDAKLADAITRIKTIAGRRLLMYRAEDGAARMIRTEEINRYLRTLAGSAVTAKDFRTLHASALAGEALAKLDPGPSVSARNRQIADVTRNVAAFLHNTPAITRKSYIAPCLFKLFETAKLPEMWAAVERHDGLKQREARLGAVLQAVAA